MIFDILGTKKTNEQLEQEREQQKAWELYGQEVEDFLNSANINREFEQLEKSKFATRPKLTLHLTQTQTRDRLLSDDIKLLVREGVIQESKAYRFMVDPELKKLLAGWKQPFSGAAEAIPLSDDLKKRVERGEIQGSKAHRFMKDPKLRNILP